MPSQTVQIRVIPYPYQSMLIMQSHWLSMLFHELNMLLRQLSWWSMLVRLILWQRILMRQLNWKNMLMRLLSWQHNYANWPVILTEYANETVTLTEYANEIITATGKPSGTAISKMVMQVMMKLTKSWKYALFQGKCWNAYLSRQKWSISTRKLIAAITIPVKT